VGRGREAARAAALDFHKYLIGRDGHVAASFATQVDPTDPRVIAAIEKELSSSPS
jgi:glutathione peroxidase